MRVALIHYWLVGMRGGEKVLEALCRIFPDADIYTHVYDPDAVSPTIARHRIKTTFISRLPMARRLYQSYLPLMPQALEELDLTNYDLVISSESGPAKGVIPAPSAVHISYCHSPMRYLWDQYHLYKQQAGPLARLAMPLLSHRLRMWDVTSAARVDSFVANSTHVANRIQKYWRRDATVVHPPVAVDDFEVAPRDEVGDYYLWLGELAPYKRPDLAIAAFTRLGLPLVVIGGPQAEASSLARDAGPTIRFLGKASFETVRHHLARCRALVFPGEEDFGLVPVEAMASGRPVVALGKGGALDTVIDGQTGVLFNEQSVEGLVSALQAFEAQTLYDVSPDALVAHARQFDENHFRDGFAAVAMSVGITL
ncbi:glycosyltransferase [Phenylobacterium sp.]|uniref:glycosyltransferase n=1 Tax=Phenylobacterium sp. TaxID=1871053 RepID=UPI002730924F|nr:glycosyltransferase [Phenylobacterium sp.]MDP1616624.1 glycosyltransferase [Phenylobacterium sp.]MDP1986321.1 glycosyltransferase [Phenylobacterium sp.]